MKLLLSSKKFIIELLATSLFSKCSAEPESLNDLRLFALDEAQMFLDEIAELNEGLPTKDLAWE